MREKARRTQNEVSLDRYRYYTGKAPAEVYAENRFHIRSERKKH